MRTMTFAGAIEDALTKAMSDDPRIVIFGEDVHALRMNLYAKFGEMRVRPTPISESAFLGAAVTAAMAGLRPVVEIMMIDFVAVAGDALGNQAAKLEVFSGRRWNAPIVVRAACGGGYGDADWIAQVVFDQTSLVVVHIAGISASFLAHPKRIGQVVSKVQA